MTLLMVNVLVILIATLINAKVQFIPNTKGNAAPNVVYRGSIPGGGIPEGIGPSSIISGGTQPGAGIIEGTGPSSIISGGTQPSAGIIEGTGPSTGITNRIGLQLKPVSTQKVVPSQKSRKPKDIGIIQSGKRKSDRNANNRPKSDRIPRETRRSDIIASRRQSKPRGKTETRRSDIIASRRQSKPRGRTETRRSDIIASRRQSKPRGKTERFSRKGAKESVDRRISNKQKTDKTCPCQQRKQNERMQDERAPVSTPGPPETGSTDSSPPETGSTVSCPLERGSTDSSPPETGSTDSGPPETGSTVSCPPETGSTVSCPPETGSTDSGAKESVTPRIRPKQPTHKPCGCKRRHEVAYDSSPGPPETGSTVSYPQERGSTDSSIPSSLGEFEEPGRPFCDIICPQTNIKSRRTRTICEIICPNSADGIGMLGNGNCMRDKVLNFLLGRNSGGVSSSLAGFAEPSRTICGIICPGKGRRKGISICGIICPRGFKDIERRQRRPSRRRFSGRRGSRRRSSRRGSRRRSSRRGSRRCSSRRGSRRYSRGRKACSIYRSRSRIPKRTRRCRRKCKKYLLRRNGRISLRQFKRCVKRCLLRCRQSKSRHFGRRKNDDDCVRHTLPRPFQLINRRYQRKGSFVIYG